MFKKILVVMTARKAAKPPCNAPPSLAKTFNAELTALWVREPLPRHTDLPGEPEEEAEAADEYFKERSREVAGCGDRTRHRHPLRNTPRPCGQNYCDTLPMKAATT